MTAHDVLVGADALLSDESKWLKGVMGMNADGNSVLPESDEACKWCLMGAVHRMMLKAGPIFSEPHVVLDSTVDALRRVIGSPMVICFNDADTTKFSDVKLALSRAIEATK